MPVLGLDTATSLASVAIVDARRVLAERVQPTASSHAATLLPLIDDVLAAAQVRLVDVSRIAVSIGPGSFTGLRIGLSVAKGLALATGIPVVGVPTLATYAHALGPLEGTVWVLCDARKGEVYAAGFRWQAGQLATVNAPCAIAPGVLAARFEGDCTLVGDGVDAYPEVWRAVPDRVARLRLAERPPTGAWVAMLGEQASCAPLAALEPAYCRATEAETRRDRLAGLSIG